VTNFQKIWKNTNQAKLKKKKLKNETKYVKFFLKLVTYIYNFNLLPEIVKINKYIPSGKEEIHTLSLSVLNKSQKNMTVPTILLIFISKLFIIYINLEVTLLRYVVMHSPEIFLQTKIKLFCRIPFRAFSHYQRGQQTQPNHYSTSHDTGNSTTTGRVHLSYTCIYIHRRWFKYDRE